MNEKPRSIFWPVLGALVVFFIVLPLLAALLFFGFAGCAAGVGGV